MNDCFLQCRLVVWDGLSWLLGLEKASEERRPFFSPLESSYASCRLDPTIYENAVQILNFSGDVTLEAAEDRRTIMIAELEGKKLRASVPIKEALQSLILDVDAAYQTVRARFT